MGHTYTWRGDTVEVPGLGLVLERDQEFTTDKPFTHPDAVEVVTKPAPKAKAESDKR